MILFSSQSLAQLRIEIRQGVERPIQIAVVPFTSQSLSSSEISNIQDVIQSDLINSGRFTTLPQESMLSRPILPSDVDFNDWRILDIDALVIGRIISSGQDQFTIHFQLFDVLRGEQLLAFRLLSDSSSFRSVGHKISDMIFAELEKYGRPHYRWAKNVYSSVMIGIIAHSYRCSIGLVKLIIDKL